MIVRILDNYTGVIVSEDELILKAYSYQLFININRFFPVSQIKLLKLFKEINNLLFAENLVRVYRALETVLTERKVSCGLNDCVISRYNKNILLVRREKEKWEKW